MVPSLTASKTDKRSARRHSLSLPGRYMLVDRTEATCQSVDVSPTGLLLLGTARPYPGQTVVVYLAELGRLEGTVVRLKAREFALRLRATDRKREQLAALLDRLAAGIPTPRSIQPAILDTVGQHATVLVPASASASAPAASPTSSPTNNPHGSFRVYLDSL
jgi:hypothetical protein